MEDTYKARQRWDVNQTATEHLLWGGPWQKIVHQCYLGSKQETHTQGNPYFLLGKTGGDVGSTFATYKSKWSQGQTVNVSSRVPPSSIWREYAGPLFARYHQRDSPPTGYGAMPFASSSQMNAYGATGIARANPTNPLAGLGQFVGEMKQLPKRFSPQLWKEAVRDLRKLSKRASDDYLNLQFGWLPFVGDMLDLYKVHRDAEKYATQILRNSGRHIRRRVTILDEKTILPLVTESTSAYPAPVLGTDFFTSTGVLTREEKLHTKIWFSGAFTYYLPKLPNGTFDRPKAQKRVEHMLLGSRLDLELLWNLAPWSWAADWIGNIGDNIRNWHAFNTDGLVMHYGYVMRKQVHEVTWTLQGVKFRNGSYPTEFTQTLTSETRQRSKATPYGFGLNPGDFSPRQLSIIAALGINRL